MANSKSVPYSRQFLVDLHSLVTSTASSRWPEVTYLMNSDVAWRLPGSAPKENIRLWYDDRGIAAYAWYSPYSRCEFDLRSDDLFDSTIFSEIINWFETRSYEFPAAYPWLLELKSIKEWEDALADGLMMRPFDKRVLQVSVLDGDDNRKQALQKLGYEPTEHFSYCLSRSLLEPIETAPLPEGFSIRSVGPSDFEERVAVHRDAWFKSSFTLEQYQQVRLIDIFEPELDLIAENEQGQFGSYCVGWIDRALGVGSFEPVGTRPEFRRLGLGKAVNFEGLRRLKNMGAHSAIIGTAGFNDRARELYTSCGFELKDRNRTWIKLLE